MALQHSTLRLKNQTPQIFFLRLKRVEVTPVAWTENGCRLIVNDLRTPYSLGQFVWTGQDYLGEPTPYQTKNAYFGHTDTAGFPKDTYFLLQAGWLPFEKQPVLHLFPYWDFSPGQPIDVRGRKLSFVRSLMMSAIGVKAPSGPTRFGP